MSLGYKKDCRNAIMIIDFVTDTIVFSESEIKFQSKTIHLLLYMACLTSHTQTNVYTYVCMPLYIMCCTVCVCVCVCVCVQ